jgi:hypothetical protein
VVTAQRFTSTVQNTPISLSAITGDQLDAAGITSVEELSHEIPRLSMRTGLLGVRGDAAAHSCVHCSSRLHDSI